jgi:hypothetical protein
VVNVLVRKVGTADCLAERLIESSRRSRARCHSVVTSAADADLLIFAGSDCGDLSDIRQDVVFRANIARSFVVYEGDWCLPLIPGVYTNLECPLLTKNWAVSGHYTGIAFCDELDEIRDSETSLLFSFVGRMKTAAVRQRLPRGETSEFFVAEAPAVNAGNYRKGYLDTLKRSRFVLCPRGYGVSSIRIFETMRAGRVPVILSDGWIPPKGPDWGAFSVRIAERDAANMGVILSGYESRWRQMAKDASQAYDDWFSAFQQFDRIVEACLSLGPRTGLCKTLVGQLQQLHRFRPSFVSRKLRRTFLSDV